MLTICNAALKHVEITATTRRLWTE